jgi:uncharacterized protein involved in propanediol utilization
VKWCPIDPFLAAEIATWERQPGPYLRQDRGAPYTTNRGSVRQGEGRYPELGETTLHGLRAARVIELRQSGLTDLQIQDQVGMSAQMIQRCCQFNDRKAAGKAAVLSLEAARRRQRKEQNGER